MYTQLETEVIVIRRDIVKILLKMQELHKFLKIYLLCLRWFYSSKKAQCKDNKSWDFKFLGMLIVSAVIKNDNTNFYEFATEQLL